MSGANTLNQAGTYGTQGTANPANMPGARSNAMGWSDAAGNLWLFGGFRRSMTRRERRNLNDLWEFERRPVDVDRWFEHGQPARGLRYARCVRRCQRPGGSI